jgi:hypothetical protein
MRFVGNREVPTDVWKVFPAARHFRAGLIQPHDQLVLLLERIPVGTNVRGRSVTQAYRKLTLFLLEKGEFPRQGKETLEAPS